MATDHIDTVIDYLMELKKQKLQLELKNEEIRKYVDLLLTKKLNDYDQSFMIYSYDTDQESIEIIGRHLMEFSEMIYDHHYLLIARKEINRNLGIYLMPFEDDCQLGTTLETVEQLIEMKRQEYENECYAVPSKRVIPEMKIMNFKMAEIVHKLEESEKQIQYKMECHGDQIKTMLDHLCQEKDRFIAEPVPSKEPIPSKDHKLQCFYTQKNLKCIRDSPEILEKMCKRMSMVLDSTRKPPFNESFSIEEKKKQLVEYFDLLQTNLYRTTQANELHIKIRDWAMHAWIWCVYKPTVSEKVKWKREMEQALNVKNTIGTVCYIPFKWSGSDCFFFFCIANSKLVCWNCGDSKEGALKNVHCHLKVGLIWDTNEKFATDMDVSDDYSDYFVHVSTEDVVKITQNQKVIDWMVNNFESLEYSFTDGYYHSFPIIYNLGVKYFEESIE